MDCKPVAEAGWVGGGMRMSDEPSIKKIEPLSESGSVGAILRRATEQLLRQFNRHYGLDRFSGFLQRVDRARRALRMAKCSDLARIGFVDADACSSASRGDEKIHCVQKGLARTSVFVLSRNHHKSPGS